MFTWSKIFLIHNKFQYYVNNQHIFQRLKWEMLSNCVILCLYI